jgi:hypothetical protein
MAQMAQAIHRGVGPPALPRRQTARPAHRACETGAGAIGVPAASRGDERHAVRLTRQGHPHPPLRAEAITAELEELPLPYRFDVLSLAHIQHRPLLEHIQRVGILIYPAL